MSLVQGGTITGVITVSTGGGGSDNLPAVLFGTNTTPTIASPDAQHKTYKGLADVTEITLSDATAINESAFENMSNLESISAPEVITVGNYAFRNCSSLETVSLPECITLGDGAFNKCGFTSINLPKVQTINGRNHFSDNSSLTDVYLGYNGVVTVDKGEYYTYSMFSGDSTYINIHVPEGQLSAYQSDATWSAIVTESRDDRVLVTFVGDYE